MFLRNGQDRTGRVVSVRVTANKLSIVADDKLILEHPRCFLRDQLLCNPWHYLPILDKKPGALRHGAPFQAWDLPVAIQQVREHLLQQEKGDRAFVDILLLAPDTGLDVLETACELALESGVISGSVVQNEIRRLIEPPRLKALKGVNDVILTTEPQPDCQHYDHLLVGRYVHRTLNATERFTFVWKRFGLR